MARHSAYGSPFNASAISVGRVSMSAWITSSISFISLSIHPSSWNTQISPAYFSIAHSSMSSMVGHLSLPFPFPLPLLGLLGLGFFPLPFPFFALSSATALPKQVSLAAIVLSPKDEPALHIIIMCSLVKQRPFPSSFSPFSPFPPFPPFPSLPPFPAPAFFDNTEATAREMTKTRIRDLMVLLVVED